jgi:putative membrane protein
MVAATLVAAPVITLHAQVGRPDSGQPRTWGGKKLPTSTATAQARSEAVNDSAFIGQALTGSVMEVRLGKLAQSKASNPAVKTFADRMVTDHTAMQNQWGTLAGKNGLATGVTLNQSQEQSLNQLEGLSGQAFDRAYMSAMVQDHQQDLDLFRREGKTADSPEVRQLATTGATTIQQHLNLARQVSNQVGGNANVAVKPQSAAAGNARQGEREELRNFVHQAADNHLMEVQLADLAQRRAKSGEVKRFAKQVADDFGKWQDRWTDLAKKNDLAFQPALGPMHDQKVDRVQKASVAGFDQVYLNTVVENLQSMVANFQTDGRSSHVPQVRNLANDELHFLQQQLATARRQQQKLNTRAEASK